MLPPKTTKAFWIMPRNSYIGLTPAKLGRNNQITAKAALPQQRVSTEPAWASWSESHQCNAEFPLPAVLDYMEMRARIGAERRGVNHAL